MIWTERELSGWGRNPRVECSVARPERRSEVVRGLDEAAARHRRSESTGALVHGMGRSYGDASLLRGGSVLLAERFDRMLSFDEESGRLHCQAGVTIDDLLRVFGPRGFFPPVVPGTRHVTVGGAIANDIHGKNHHVDGTFTDHVESLELLTADGEVVSASREQEPELFGATVAGLGLTGVILGAVVRLAKVGGPYLEVESVRVRDLDHFFEVSAESADFTHVVSWVDTLARGRRMGRGIVMRGRHVGDATTGRDGLLGRLPLAVPFPLPNWVLNRWTLRAFNEVFYRKQWRARTRALVHYQPWFFPLDAVGSWNRAYGRRGLLQYQLVVPRDPEHRAIRAIFDRVTRAGLGSFLSVLKEFGDSEHGGLSFPMPGVTLALDFPHYGDDLLRLLDELDRVVVEAGGRVYLGKDARLGAEMFREMYPAWRDWKAIRDRWDPRGLFCSELGLRVGLVGDAAAEVAA